jgi:hypothetical protein
MGAKLLPWAVDHGEAEVFGLVPKPPVVLLFKALNGGSDSPDFSLSFSFMAELVSFSLKSVLRRRSAGGGVAADDSSLEKREVAGEAVLGKGKESLVSRRRPCGRVEVGDDRP